MGIFTYVPVDQIAVHVIIVGGEARAEVPVE
jgi:hypothetical protein